jgi:hypothetical protein
MGNRIKRFISITLIAFIAILIFSCRNTENIKEVNIEHIDMYDISCNNNINDIDSIIKEQGYNGDLFEDLKNDTSFYYTANNSDCIYKMQSSKWIHTTPKSRKIYFYQISFEGDSITKTIYDKYYKLYGKPSKVSYHEGYTHIPIQTLAIQHGISPYTEDFDSIIFISKIENKEAEILWNNSKGEIELECYYSEYYNNGEFNANLKFTDKHNQALNLQERKDIANTENIIEAIYLVISIIFIIIIILTIVKASDNMKKKSAERNKVELEKRVIEEAKILKYKEEYLSKIKSFENQYGELTKEIRYRNILNGYNNSKINDTIYIFESTSTIMINNQVLKFKDILGFNVFDNSTVIYSGQTAVTKSKTGSSLGRAVVGGALLGGVGAIIGGTTGKKETVLSAQTSSVNHSYTIVININDLSTPLIKLTLGDSQGLVQMISSILTIICERNKTSD